MVSRLNVRVISDVLMVSRLMEDQMYMYIITHTRADCASRGLLWVLGVCSVTLAPFGPPHLNHKSFA